MRILTRYLIRSHVGPFLFAVSALTGLLFLNAVAQKLGDLAGKGLTWDVIVDFLVLSLPHTVALTFPMAVLVAVLYAFSDLAANNEVTALKAGGVQPFRFLLPLLGVGCLVAGGMLLFNDRVLPEANHRLKNLLLDINRKTPTFALREQVVNEIESTETGDRFFLQAARIDNESNELFDIMIVDANDPLRYRTTVAGSGVMAFNAARTDLYLTLFDGVAYESSEEPPGNFQTVFFERQVIPLRGVGNEMERRMGAARGDREMSLAMLAEQAALRRAEADSVRSESLRVSRIAVQAALGHGVTDSTSVVGRAARVGALGSRRPGASNLDRDELTRTVSITSRTHSTRISALRQSVNQKEVEIHKKISLAVACAVFVLVGAPLALRFPRGGLGLVIAASSFIFAVYWMGLIGGESLADRGVASPALAMWIPNVVFTLLGVILVGRMGREASTTRGGGWEDLFFTLRQILTSPLGTRRKPDTRPGGATA